MIKFTRGLSVDQMCMKVAFVTIATLAHSGTPLGKTLIEFIPNFLCRPQMLATLGNVMKFGVQKRLFAQFPDALSRHDFHRNISRYSFSPDVHS